MTPKTIKNIKKFRKNLKDGKTLIGGWMQISNSNLAEIMGDFNYDWKTETFALFCHGLGKQS